MDPPAPPAPALPYPPRPGQPELMQAAAETSRTGGQILLEAGTGTGKTVAVLAAALHIAREQDKRVVWLTRTNTQQQQVVREFRALVRHHPAPRPLLVALQGRAHLCPELKRDPRYVGADADEYARLCGTLKRRTLQALGLDAPGTRADGHDDRDVLGRPNDVKTKVPPPIIADSNGGCRWFQGLLSTDLDTLRTALADDPSSSEVVAARLTDAGVCPYEAVKALLRDARVVVAPYVYLAEPALARALHEWLGAAPADCIVVVDEAHNLPEFLRELLSPELSLASLQRARAEAEHLGDPLLGAGATATQLVETVAASVRHLAKERIPEGETEGLLAPDDLAVALLGALRTTSPTLLRMADVLIETGEALRRSLAEQGRLPRSYLGHLGTFLSAWFRSSDEEHVPIVATSEEDPRLVLYALDPSLGAAFLAQAHAALHMSGTLRPFDQYRDVLALGERTRTLHLPSPFAKERLRLVLVDDVTTRFAVRGSDPAVMDRLFRHLESFLSVRGLNTAVFFPSHALMDGFLELGLDSAPDRHLFVEERGMDQDALVRAVGRFCELGAETAEGGPGAAFLGVVGGRLAEGIDFPGRALEALAIVGMPYPRPTARQRALVRAYDIRFQRGWDYAVEAPTLRRVQQAIGRVIRDAKDTGIVFLLDDRFRRHAASFERLERLGDDESIHETLEAFLATRGDDELRYPFLTSRAP